jgi:transcriptional regulator with XRE-family HTH domain
VNGSHLIREARRRAGITQAELATRAGTTQSAIARLEAGRSAPTLEHLDHLVRCCGFEVAVQLLPVDDATWAQARANLARSPEERIRSLLAADRLVQAGRAARARKRSPVVASSSARSVDGAAGDAGG